MYQFIEIFRTGLDGIGEVIELMLNALSVLCIVVGVILAFTTGLQMRKRSSKPHPLHTYFRMIFGGWLVVALEFQLAADIVGTIISPTDQQLIELAAIATIRTFLNYFLNKELLEEREITRAEIEKTESLKIN